MIKAVFKEIISDYGIIKHLFKNCTTCVLQPRPMLFVSPKNLGDLVIQVF